MGIPAEVQAKLDAQMESIKQMTPAFVSDMSGMDMGGLRAGYIQMLAQQPAPDNVTIDNFDLGGVPAIGIRPVENVCGRVLMYIHGGGYIVGAPAGYHGLGGALANALGATVYLPEYRKAPEFPYPTPIDDVLTAYRSLLEAGHDPKKIAFCGDSAGGAMTVSVMVRARDAGLPLPAAGAALSPWANLEHTGMSMTSQEGIDPTNTKAALDGMARVFLAGAPTNSPDASPVFADVRGLPPILIQVGELELMLSDAIRLAEHLSINRVRTTLEVWPGMFHVWQMYQTSMPEAVAAIENVALFLRQSIEAE